MTENCSTSITVRKVSDIVWKLVGIASNFSDIIIIISGLSGVQTSSCLRGELEDERSLSEEDEAWLSHSFDLARCCETTAETRQSPCGKSSAERVSHALSEMSGGANPQMATPGACRTSTYISSFKLQEL